MKFSYDHQELTIALKKFEQVWSFKGQLRVAKPHITDVSWHQSFDAWRTIEFRLPGTHAPGALIAGSFWTKEGWDFVYVTRPQGFFRPRAAKVIVIETSQARYHRIILSCSKKQADEIAAWWRS